MGEEIRRKPVAALVVCVAICLALAACGSGSGSRTPASAGGPPRQPPAEEWAPILLATTTSTNDTGLLDDLIPFFQERTGWRVKVLAVGSGQALALAERGEADLVLSHAPEAEERFMAAGAGTERRRLMFNDFVLVGPEDDAAGTRATRTAADALRAIAGTGALFVSRGDESGTHQMERALWRAAGVAPPPAPRYLETGQGMAATLRVASERRGYTLSDRGTFLTQRPTLDLAIVVEGDPALRNVYHVILVDPRRSPRINGEGARALAGFLFSEEGLARIDAFGRERFGRPLFIPDPEARDGR